MGGIKKYMQPIEVDNINILKSLPNHQKGEIAIVKDEQQNYVYVDEEKGWVPLKTNIESNGLKMNLYELNKSIVSQLPVFDDNAWNGTEKVINDWFQDQLNQTKKPKYFMLYGKDISYFTVFRRVTAGFDYENFFSALKDILINIGDVYAIDPVEDKSAIEIWIRYIDEDQKIDEMTCLYLFNYDEGVITFHE